MKVICGNCENILDEEELELFRDDGGWFKGCPYCKTDGYLKDLEEPMEEIITWLDKAINDPISNEIQAPQKAKYQTYDYELIRKYNREIDLLVYKLYYKYIGDIVNKNATD